MASDVVKQQSKNPISQYKSLSEIQKLKDFELINDSKMIIKYELQNEVNALHHQYNSFLNGRVTDANELEEDIQNIYNKYNYHTPRGLLEQQQKFI